MRQGELSYAAFEAELRKQGCGVAGYRLLSPEDGGYSEFCCRRLVDDWRVITTFEPGVWPSWSQSAATIVAPSMPSVRDIRDRCRGAGTQREASLLRKRWLAERRIIVR